MKYEVRFKGRLLPWHKLSLSLATVGCFLCVGTVFAQETLLRVYLDSASKYKEQEKLDRAAKLYEQALSICEEIPASEAGQLEALQGLASVHQAKGRSEDAEIHYQKALKVGEKALGAEHPRIAQVLSALAMLYESDERFVEAMFCYKRAALILQKSPGNTGSIEKFQKRIKLLESKLNERH